MERRKPRMIDIKTDIVVTNDSPTDLDNLNTATMVLKRAIEYKEPLGILKALSQLYLAAIIYLESSKISIEEVKGLSNGEINK